MLSEKITEDGVEDKELWRSNVSLGWRILSNSLQHAQTLTKFLNEVDFNTSEANFVQKFSESKNVDCKELLLGDLKILGDLTVILWL